MFAMRPSGYQGEALGQTGPMLLVGREGNELELGIVGYQFPHVDRDPWDSNWLVVAIRVVSGDGSWEVLDPCLTTWEAKHLVAWLVQAAAREPAAVPMAFTEPNLTFTAKATPRSATQVQLRACFQLELRPPWARMAAGSDHLCVDLEVERADLARAAASLLADLVRFPQRGDDPTL
jgi:hypothetical protein